MPSDPGLKGPDLLVVEFLKTAKESGMKAESSGRAKRPLNGEEYLQSIRDDREVWVYGERVKDVTVHPGFRNAARMIARMYDSLHDPAKQEVLTTPTDTGNG